MPLGPETRPRVVGNQLSGANHQPSKLSVVVASPLSATMTQGVLVMEPNVSGGVLDTSWGGGSYFGCIHRVS